MNKQLVCVIFGAGPYIGKSLALMIRKVWIQSRNSCKKYGHS